MKPQWPYFFDTNEAAMDARASGTICGRAAELRRAAKIYGWTANGAYADRIMTKDFFAGFGFAGRAAFAALALVCAADDPLADGANVPVELAVLGDAVRVAVGSPHVLPPAISAMQRELLAHVDPKRVMMCPNIEVILALVSAGIACTLLPDVAALRREGLRFLPVEGVEPAICGVRTRRGRLPKLLSDFIALLA